MRRKLRPVTDSLVEQSGILQGKGSSLSYHSTRQVAIVIAVTKRIAGC